MESYFVACISGTCDEEACYSKNYHCEGIICAAVEL